MNFFQTTLLRESLGSQLREARISRKLTVEKAAKALHLSVEEVESLEDDLPLDMRRARIQVVSYLRFLGMNPTEFKDLLPPLPELCVNRDRVQLPRENPLLQFILSLLAMLAPMGRFALVLIFTVMLLGSWGLVRQLSRVRSMPWISSTYTMPNLPVR